MARDSGDLAYALRLLASGQSMAVASKEAGYKSRKVLADRIYDLAERVESGEVGGGKAGSGKAGGGKTLSLIAYSDGASIGNPGEAGCGALLIDHAGQVLMEDYKYLGRATNNVAEYEGAILALKLASELGAGQVELRVDSGLLANQITGKYRVKSTRLAHLYENLKEMTKLFEDFSITQIGRDDNKQADRLANLAISSRKRR